MATKRWLGKALDVQQVDTHTFSGTPKATDRVTVTINSKAIVLTLGTDVTLTDVAAETAAMINARSATAGLLGAPDETRNFGGQEFPEFTEIVATASAAVLVTKSTAGVPVTITVAVTQVGGSSTIAVASVATTAATGKNFFDNGANWSSAPTTGDTILFDQGSTDVKYALNNTVADLNFKRLPGYTGNVGLPAVNPLGYAEYRQQYLDLPATGGSGVQTHTFGALNSPTSPVGYTQLDFGATDGDGTTIYLYDAPQPSNAMPYSVKIIRGSLILLEAYSGSISFGSNLLASTNTKFETIEIHGDAVVLLDEKSELSANSTIWQTGGTLRFYSGSADSTPTVTIDGGTAELTMNTTPANGFTTCSLRGGTTYLEANVTTMYVYGGATLSENKDQRTVTNCNVYQGAAINNRTGMLTFSSGLDLHGCQPSDVTLSFPDHLTWTPSAIT